MNQPDKGQNQYMWSAESRQWRLIYDSPTHVALNMARDEALLESVAASPPTLRFYYWNPPCLSLGYGQKARDVDFERVAAYGWDVVRRPTGGRAILHTDELTYSVTLPLTHPLASGSIIESYHRISSALLAGLRLLDIAPQAERAERRAAGQAPICFEVASHYEITVNGRKLVGSAQARRKGGLLQHGTLPLCGDITRICDALRYPDEAARQSAKAQVGARAITLADALNGQAVTWQQAAEAIAQGFAQTFGITFIIDSYSPHENQRADELRATVYRNHESIIAK